MFRPPKNEATANLDDAKFVIQETGGWIRHADAKVAILATVIGVVFGIGAAHGQLVFALFQKGGWWSAGTAVLLTIALLSIFGILVSTVIALVPRTHAGELPSRYSWPELARQRLAPASLLNREVEAWTQAMTLSRIAKIKFRAFNVAMLFSLVFMGAAASIAALRYML
jgi:hypothetical protein